MAYNRVTIRWTDDNLLQLFDCCLYPEAYELPPDEFAPALIPLLQAGNVPVPVRSGGTETDTDPGTSTITSTGNADGPRTDIATATATANNNDGQQSADTETETGTATDNGSNGAQPDINAETNTDSGAHISSIGPQPNPDTSTNAVQPDSNSDRPPWNQTPWQHEIFRSYIRVSKGLPPTGPVHTDEEDLVNSRLITWMIGVPPSEVAWPPGGPWPMARWFEYLPNMSISSNPDPNTKDHIARVGHELASVLSRRDTSYECPLTQVIHDFLRWRYTHPDEAERYQPEWEYAGLRMRRKVADLEYRGFGGDRAARDHACISHILLNTFQTIEMDICGITETGVIVQWEELPTASAFPVSVWFMVNRTGTLYKLTMKGPFRKGRMPVARALNGTMAFQEVEQGPNILQLFTSVFDAELNRADVSGDYLPRIFLSL
ncbi:hypothetical protein A1O1_07982 [Capronia coronata CBS 617.96]|uniref:Uncharacterized protein n=1 Tax=Capronia coronata CBS 617.96 TaxID=1182541 RepID=W9XX46_9EURO|nr:uncharacterized protein A1O1_07982 [Capronia coronata CBS 617.96]EXJ81915.1 hypothetical protein A1O1_07982 [Capronia coronata CBS 617.96]